MILSKVYEDAENRLERNEITLGEFERLVDIEVIVPKRGEWIVHKERTVVNDGFIDFFPTEYECSNCGLKQSMYFINSKPSNFCPNCGASMRERKERAMTIEEAKAVIYGNVVYACEKAGFSPYTTKLVQDACDMIIAMADCKDEPQTDERSK